MSKRVVFTASEKLASQIEEEAERLGLNKSEICRNHIARSINQKEDTDEDRR